MRNKFLNMLVDLAVHRRRTVWIVGLLLTILLGAASTKIMLDVRWSTLLPESMAVVQEYNKINDHYLQPHNMIVAITGPDRAKLESITDEAAAILQKELVCDPQATAREAIATGRYARYVYGKNPVDWLEENLFRLAKPKDARRQADLYRDPRLLPFLIHLNDDFETEYTDAENVKSQEREIVGSLNAVQGLIEAIEAAADGEVAGEAIARTVRDLTIGNPYFMSLDNSMSLIFIASAIPSDNTQANPLIDKRIEELLEPLVAENPDYRIERTGLIAISRDEMDSIGPETMRITLLALLLVFLLLVWNFRSLLTPILALIPIIVGIIWSVGVIALTLGQMNLITVMIMVVLLGLGIDFSIHLANRFQEEIIAGDGSIEQALRKTIEETGSAVITGALTTAIAFYMLMVAETKGIDEFGFCAGTGVLITLAAVLLLLPALLATQTDWLKKRNRLPVKGRNFSALGAIAVWMGRFRYPVIVLVLAAVIAGIWAGNELKMEWNFLNLEPEGLRSIILQDEIVEKFKLSTTVSLLTATGVEESRSLRRQFKDKSVVGEVDDISLWVSRPDFPESLKYIRRLRQELDGTKGELSFIAGSNSQRDLNDAMAGLSPDERRQRIAEELDRLWANLVEIQALSFIGGQDRVVEKTTQLVAERDKRDQGMLRQVADRFLQEDAVDWQRVEEFSLGFSEQLGGRVVRMAEGDAPVGLDAVPQDIREKYTSRTMPGFLMMVMPRKNLYEKPDLDMFLGVTAKIDPNITGDPQMILHMNLATMREGKLAFAAAALFILLVLLVDFRRPLTALLAFLPLVAGIGLMLGLMWLLGEKINYINMIALPVIIGIGVDDGVHFFHRLIQEGRGGMKRAVSSVGRAMLMSSLTTMIGFGSLMFYLMRGMASLGLVLFIGVGACLFTTFTLLPALASLFENSVMKNAQTGVPHDEQH